MPMRRLPVEGLYNARDLGGYPTKDGGATRFGVFIRSATPNGLSEEAIAYLRDYGITASLDFRGGFETRHQPSPLNGPMKYYNKPLFNEAAIGMGPGGDGAGFPPPGGPSADGAGFPPPGGPSADGAKFPPPGGPGGPGGAMPGKMDFGAMYRQMAEEARDWAVEVLTIAAENDGGLLYHCSAGKDRTGIMSCYLLSIAGVPKEDIAADYCVSEVYLEPMFKAQRKSPPPFAQGQPMPPEDDSFNKTPASAMLELISYLDETYGGVVEYLRMIGVPEEVMAQIREKLVEK